jgi:hypothetical protein
MPSLINYTNIDDTYPIAGQDNDSQGFRTNFYNIKESLRIAQEEVTTLQTNLVAAVSDIAVKGLETAQYEVPSTGTTITVANSTSVLIANPTATIASLTIVFPTAPVNGQTLSIAFGAEITALTLSSTGTIRGSLTSATSNSHIKWVYSSVASTWFKLD